MADKKKIFAGCLILLGLAFITISVALFLMFRAGESLFENVTDAQQEAIDFVDKNPNDPERCLTEGLKRIDKCGRVEMMCQTGAASFAQICLNLVKRPANFCDDVPSVLSPVDLNMWYLKKCNKLDRGSDTRCQQIMMAIPQVCQNEKINDAFQIEEPKPVESVDFKRPGRAAFERPQD